MLDTPGLSAPVVTEVVQVLGEAGDPRAVDTLVRVLDTHGPGQPITRAVVTTLVRIGDRRAVPALSAMLGDAADRDNEGWVRVLAWSLIKLGDPSALPVLRRVDPGPVELPSFRGELVRDDFYEVLESRKALHDGIAEFDKRAAT
jgi:HEAT repeat protein